MFTKSTLLGTLIGGIVLNLLGWVFYDSVAASFFEEHALSNMNTEMNPLYISIGSLIIAFAMSNLYKNQKRNYGISSGFTFGVWIGILFGFGLGMVMYGTNPWLDLYATLVDCFWAIVYYGITGASIGWVYKANHSLKPIKA